MKKDQNNLTFETENLEIDWISFNLEDLKESNHWEDIAKYLFNVCSFNISFMEAKNPAASKKLFVDKKNNYECNFEKGNNPYWKGFQLSFSGKNAAYFYSLVKKKLFKWSIIDLQLTTLALGRLDIQYVRKPKKTDASVKDFFDKTSNQVEMQKTRSVINTAPRGGSPKLLKIGKRSSPRHYRIYETDMGLKFEFEIKGILAKSFQDYLFLNQLETFEKEVIKEFYKHSRLILPLTESYTDWLIAYLRKTRKRENRSLALVSTYLKSTLSENADERANLFKLFQFLSFVNSLKEDQRVKKNLSSQIYYQIDFRLQEFIDFLGLKNSYYQIKKTKDFFDLFYDLQRQQKIMNQIDENGFRSYVLFPVLSIEKSGKSNCWTISISIAEQLFFYLYPYLLPLEFVRVQNKLDSEVKKELWHVMSNVSAKKNLALRDFLSRFAVSNSMRTQIKKKIIELLELLERENCINSEFRLMEDNEDSGKKILLKDLNVGVLKKIEYIQFFEAEPK